MYESAGVDFMKYVRTVTMTRPGVESPALRRQAIVRNTDGGGVSVDLLSRKGKRPNTRHGEHAHTQLDRVLAGSADPRELAVTIERPTDDPAKRAILAWSFLALFYYAGYRYAASAGAEQVRQLILDPSLPLPAGLVYTKGSIAMPLAAPEPVLVVRVEHGEEVEVIALGVVWDRLVVVFPFASDHGDRSWSRIAELLALDALKTTEVRPLRINHPSMAKELTELLEVRIDDGVRHAVNGDLSPVEVEALAAGVSPRRLDPRAGGSWRTPVQIEQEFITVEGEAPAPDRVSVWRSKFAGLPGGFLPRLVAQLLEEVPGVPMPMPDPLPLAMARASNEWVATLSIGGRQVRSAGASPADAIGLLLARVEALYETMVT
jgi:hypothetical protein